MFEWLQPYFQGIVKSCSPSVVEQDWSNAGPMDSTMEMWLSLKCRFVSGTSEGIESSQPTLELDIFQLLTSTLCSQHSVTPCNCCYPWPYNVMPYINWGRGWHNGGAANCRKLWVICISSCWHWVLAKPLLTVQEICFTFFANYWQQNGDCLSSVQTYFSL